MKKKLKVGDVTRWQGFMNSDVGRVTGGYLWFVKELDKDGSIKLERGIKIEDVKNRWEAIKKYNLNPKNPNNSHYVADRT